MVLGVFRCRSDIDLWIHEGLFVTESESRSCAHPEPDTKRTGRDVQSRGRWLAGLCGLVLVDSRTCLEGIHAPQFNGKRNTFRAFEVK